MKVTLCLECGEPFAAHKGIENTCPPDFDPQYGTWDPDTSND